MEAKVQSEIIKHLHSLGCYVIKTKPGMGTKVGMLDILFLKEGFWGVIECKRSADAPYQPLQKETLKKLGDWSYARVAYPENVLEIKVELTQILKG